MIPAVKTGGVGKYDARTKQYSVSATLTSA